MTSPSRMVLIAGIAATLATSIRAADPVAAPSRRPVKLPGLVIDFENRCIDLEGSICLDRGYLELVACTKGSKEHEAIVAVDARPMHVHTALLLLGANAGHPATGRPLDPDGTRWVHFPAAGDAVDVFLVVEDERGRSVERPVSDFVARSEERGAETRDGDDGEPRARRLPHTFLFAGSRLRDVEQGPRRYLADHSGNVVSIVTFGDELLCLPEVHSRTDDALQWRIDPTHLPKVGTQVTLRLRPQPAKRRAETPRNDPDGTTP